MEALARYRDANLLFLRAISDGLAYGQSWTNQRVTAALIDAKDDVRWCWHLIVMIMILLILTQM